MDDLLDRLSLSVVSAQSVEELTRPLLEMLETITGLESTYLTSIDFERGVQHILYARTTGSTMQIPEGLSVPWNDTLCKRALDEKRPCTNDVKGTWPDSEAAAALGIQTYVSTPVYAGEDMPYGTLCAASAARHEVDARAQHLLVLFARLIGQQVERERLLQQLLQANAQLTDHASTDPLTGLPNRRALLRALRRQLAQGDRQDTTVLVGFLDLDGFKFINDRHGHAVGDEFLVQMAQRIQQAMRAQDMAARYGGDEFAVIGPGPATGDGIDAAVAAFTERIARATQGVFECRGVEIDYAGASMGAVAIAPRTLDADAALREADAQMYRAKESRNDTRR